MTEKVTCVCQGNITEGEVVNEGSSTTCALRQNKLSGSEMAGLCAHDVVMFYKMHCFAAFFAGLNDFCCHLSCY